MARDSFDFVQLAKVLERRYPRVQLVASREAYLDAIRFDMRCHAYGGIRINADVADPRLWRNREAAVDLLFRHLDELYAGIHTSPDRDNYRWQRVKDGVTPLVECGLCKTSQPVPGEKQGQDFEFCERQAVLWMQRAEQMRPRE